MAGTEGVTAANPGTTGVCAEETAADVLDSMDGQSVAPTALEYVPEKFKNDPDVVKAAIANDGRTSEYKEADPPKVGIYTSLNSSPLSRGIGYYCELLTKGLEKDNAKVSEANAKLIEACNKAKEK